MSSPGLGTIFADSGIMNAQDVVVAGYVGADNDAITTVRANAHISVTGVVEAGDFGILAGSLGSRIEIGSSGLVRAGSDRNDASVGSAAVYLFGGVLINEGTISAETNVLDGRLYAVSAGTGNQVQEIFNAGTVVGDVSTFGGDDLYDATSGGTVVGTIDLGAGADTIRGGSALDTLSYGTSTAGVVVDLLAGIGSGGHVEGDRIAGIAYLIGSAHEDTLIGDGAANNFAGGDSRDVLLGGGQGDILRGEGVTM